MFQPDVVFVSNGRQMILTDEGDEGAPDLVVEILSPRTGKLDRGVKRDICARTGVIEMWIVDPELKTVQVFRFAESADVPRGTYRVGQKFSSLCFPELQIRVAEVFKQ